MKQAHERGELGAWLVAQRRRLGEERGLRLTQQQVVEEIAQQGYPIDASYYRALESGAKKTAAQDIHDAFARYFGRTPPRPTGGASEGAGELAVLMREQLEATRAQTTAITQLVESLRDRDPQEEANLHAEALASHLAPLLASLLANQRQGERQ